MHKLEFFAIARGSDICNFLVKGVKDYQDKLAMFSVIHRVKLWEEALKSEIYLSLRDVEICLLALYLPLYIASHCLKIRTLLIYGYIFFFWSGDRRWEFFLYTPVTYSAIHDRLNFYLQTFGIVEGETHHTLRAGWSVTLAMGEEIAQENSVMSHKVWSGAKLPYYYSRATQLKDD